MEQRAEADLGCSSLICQRCEKSIRVSEEIDTNEELWEAQGGRSILRTDSSKEGRLVALFEYFSSVSVAGCDEHPLCEDCAGSVSFSQAQELAERAHEIAHFQETLQMLSSPISDENGGVQTIEEAIQSLQAIERDLQAQIEACNHQLEVSVDTLTHQHFQSLRIETMVSSFDHLCCDVEGHLVQFRDELQRDSVGRCLIHSVSEAWKDSKQYLPGAFEITFEGFFGCINRLRLGTCTDIPVSPFFLGHSDSHSFQHQVDWQEQSAAWGYTVCLLHHLAKRQQFEFKR